MTIKLDLKDKKLLYELDINSRQSASKLAKKIGISKQGCTFKINNLVKKKVINAFPASLNIALMGHLSFRLYFKLIDISPEKEEEFRNFLINHEDVPWVVECEGLWDYIFVVFPIDFTKFEEDIREITNKYGAYIEKKDIALVTQANHFRSGFIFGKKKDIPPLIYAGQPKESIELDKKDRNILKFLAQDSRMPIIEIAKALNINPKVVSYRIDKLEQKNVIEGYSLSIDYNLIGFQRYKVFILTKNMDEKKEKQFIEFSRMHPNFLYYSKSIGSYDVELELIVEDSTYLRQIIAEIRRMFSGIIKSYEIVKIFKEYKLNFYPWKE